MSKLSIITINFNNRVGLQKTLQSVFEQSWQDFEHIIIDGGSTDGSVALMRENQDKFSYSVSEPDRGVYNAMNKGIAAAKGEYLLFLNSGDHFYSNNVLKKNHQHLANEDIIYFELEVIGQKKKFIKQYPDKLSFAYFLKDSLPHPATFIKAKTLKNYGSYDEELRVIADWKFFIDSICKNNVSYRKVNNTLSTFYLDGMSSKPAKRNLIVMERNTILESEYPAFVKDIEDIVHHRDSIQSLKNSRIIQLLIRFGFLNKF
ncbi:hypothetical protein FFWV33_07860 [Flavobacterium faecale]|uniref:Glycosyltransferase 2-like domain-containing protein n=1 Tax=Flavobacterium faecale TaxID=1355330 RepID=A0A2S1LCI7_9FLAO|nr:glycosyltransferase family 2 protein [Flavobacterium faecale]AWG21454.1 hypothetical protein FFWV33_07860 [Flavobacterium faecale]